MSRISWAVIMNVAVDALPSRLVPNALWELVESPLAGFSLRPQGSSRAVFGDRMVFDDRAMFTAIVYVLTSGSRGVFGPETVDGPAYPACAEGGRVCGERTECSNRDPRFACRR